MSDAPGPAPAGIDDPVADPVAQWAAAIAHLDRAHQAVLGDVNACGVPAPWFTVLAHLQSAPGHRLPMGEIARELSMTTGGFTKLADRMAQAGLIDRRGASRDRRMVYAALTDRGREQAEQARAVFDRAVHDHVLSALTAQDVRTLADIGRRLAAANATDAPERQATHPDADAFALAAPPEDAQDRRRPDGDAPRP